MTSNLIYLDNNATTPIDPRVLDAMMPFLTNNFANANSSHAFGLGAHEAVKKARQQVADLIGAEAHEVIFTSGATEAINLAIKGVAEKYRERGKHIVTVSTEHSAVLDTCRNLETKGFEVTYLLVQSDGLLDLDVVKAALRPDTILVSVMYVNNETGVIQDIKKISELAHANGSLFMTDATQAVGKIPVDVDELDVDLLCFSGHKMYAPKGVGSLFVRQRGPRRIKIPALIHGGGHERGLRSGTLNVPGIVALGEACELAGKEMNLHEIPLRKLRDELETELLKLEGTSVNGSTSSRLYNVSNICFEGGDSEALILILSSNQPMIAVSNGSACTSAVLEPSHVLTAMGKSQDDAFSSIRFSFGKQNKMEDLAILIPQINLILKRVSEH